jgi:hypothetical protein
MVMLQGLLVGSLLLALLWFPKAVRFLLRCLKARQIFIRSTIPGPPAGHPISGEPGLMRSHHLSVCCAALLLLLLLLLQWFAVLFASGSHVLQSIKGFELARRLIVIHDRRCVATGSGHCSFGICMHAASPRLDFACLHIFLPGALALCLTA